MLSARYRFHGHGSLRYVYKNGQAVRTRLLTVKYTRNKHRKHSRFAVVVSKKVHKSAVGRNRIRRRTYEVIRHELPKISSAHDIVVIITSSEVLTLPAPELQQIIQQSFEQAQLYK
jgi:ribonuclease P protein component